MLFRAFFLALTLTLSALAGIRSAADAECTQSAICPGTAVVYAPTFGNSGCGGTLTYAWVSSQTAYAYFIAESDVSGLCVDVWYSIDTWVQGSGTARYNDSGLQWDRFPCMYDDCGTLDYYGYLSYGPSYICEVPKGDTYYTHAMFNASSFTTCSKGIGIQTTVVSPIGTTL